MTILSKGIRFLFGLAVISTICLCQICRSEPTPATGLKDSNSVAPKTDTSAGVDSSTNLQSISHRIDILEKQFLSQSPKDWKSQLISGLPVLIAAGIGALITLITQWFTTRREREGRTAEARQQLELSREAAKQQLDLAMKQAHFAQMERILEFKLKQMEKFYAPMFAFLKQSTALYQKMCEQLAEDHPDRYKRLQEPDADGNIIHVKSKDGSWKQFRMLDQMPTIKSDPNAKPLIESMIKIGKKTTDTISEQAGLASAELIDLLGEYLAHYAILCAAFESLEAEPKEPMGHRRGYFPRDLGAKVEQGYRELSRSLDDYGRMSDGLLEKFQKMD